MFVFPADLPAGQKFIILRDGAGILLAALIVMYACDFFAKQYFAQKSGILLGFR